MEGFFRKSSVFINLYKAFDCISLELLVVKLHAYGICLNSASFYIHVLKAVNHGDRWAKGTVGPPKIKNERFRAKKIDTIWAKINYTSFICP